MDFDKRTQRQKSRTAVSTDLTSTDGSYEEIHSAPSLPRKEHSGDHSNVSKFSEAMNNPDWRRRRREGNSTYDSMATTSSNSDWSIIGSGESFHVHPNREDCILHRKNRGHFPWDCSDNASPWQSSLNSSEVSTRDMGVAPVDEDYTSMDSYQMNAAVKEKTEGDVHGLCVMLKNFEICDSSKDVRMLHLAPIFPGASTSQNSGQVIHEDGSIYRVAHIQRTSVRLPRWRPSGEDANGKHRTTFISSPHRSSTASYRTMRSSGEENIERARKVVFQDLAVADVGSKIGETREKTSTLPSRVSGNKGAKDELSIRSEAFKKILRKLHSSRTEKSKNEVAGSVKNETEEVDAGFKKFLKNLHHESGQEIRHPGTNPTDEHFYQHELSKGPHGVLKKRNDGSSGLPIVSAYTENPSKKDWSQDSGVCMDTHSFNAGLNPRAREFLSFKNFTRASESSDDPGLPDDELSQQMYLDKGSEDSECPVNGPAAKDLTSANHHLSFVKPNGFNRSNSENANSETSSAPVGGQGPAGFGLTSDMLSFPNVAFPFGTYQTPMQNITSPELISSLELLASIGKWSPATGFGNQLNSPTTSLPFQPCAIAPHPPITINTTPQLPLNPTLRGSGYLACPPPVSKPMFPDPVQQQRYEEYIEWRKLNEPGYALACKTRQQRRAQRGSNTPHSALGKV
ncbi:hypothetical protein FLONG3_8299 [Fusarium longipes]|uniref:Uncharacterized protein n=1 Tax=Fusarium longipes TaxID=694270 RepID=A0A395S7A1_9HYPO|nr:hypothetical protein FLONG3_8299 [Fusarium longipes]